MLNFVAIDFETADCTRFSPCEIGITLVKNNQIELTQSWFIKPPCYPEFAPFNVHLHGITPDHVKDAKEFPAVWQEVEQFIHGFPIVAHNARFDLSVIRQTCDEYKIDYPVINYFCSCNLSRKALDLPGYSLDQVCEYLGIPLDHHRAGSDSSACAGLCLELFKRMRVDSIDELEEKVGISFGRMNIQGYTPSRLNTGSKELFYYRDDLDNPHRSGVVRNRDKISADMVKDEYTHPIFSGKKVVFTGTLTAIIRAEAGKIIEKFGGKFDNGLTQKTNILVIGQTDFRAVKNGKSQKHQRAEKMKNEGHDIEIMSEEFFMQNIFFDK